MKKIIETIKNIWRIEDLRNRILITFGILAIYRLGSFVVIPGIDPSQLAALQAQTSDGLLGLLNMFTGGAFSQASIFALGIMPYISASIVIQLLGMGIPYFQKLQKEGESGRRSRGPNHNKKQRNQEKERKLQKSEAPTLVQVSYASQS